MPATCCAVPLSGPSHCQRGDRPASPEHFGDVPHQSGPDQRSRVRRGLAPSWGDKVRSHPVGQATGRTGWRGQGRGGARGPALSARPRTRSRRHLSRSAAGGPRARVAGTRGSGDSRADSPCSRGASPPEAATRSAAGRRSRPRWPRHRPRSPCRRRLRAADGREPAGLPRPAPPRPRGGGTGR